LIQLWTIVDVIGENMSANIGRQSKVVTHTLEVPCAPPTNRAPESAFDIDRTELAFVRT
jgi:hypothetical protein